MAVPTKENSEPIALNTKETPTIRSGSSRRIVRLGILAAVLAAPVWFAPSLIAKTSLRQRIVKLILPTFSGTVEIGETSLGWASPLVVKGIRVEDRDAQVLLQVKQFSTVETLWTLCTRPNNLGRINVLDPVVNVALANDSSNFENLLTELNSSPSSGTPIPAFELAIVNARIELADKTLSCRTTIAPISLVMTSTSAGIDVLELTVGDVPPAILEPKLETSAQSRGGTTESDWLSVRLSRTAAQPGDVATTDRRQIRLQAQGWKLDKLRPLLTRFERFAELAGDLDADANVEFLPTEESFDWGWSGTLAVKQFRLAGLTLLKNDRIVLEGITFRGNVLSQNDRIVLDDAKLSTDVSELSATGVIPRTAFTEPAGFHVVETAAEEDDFQISGFVDLKKLALILPQTLRIRQGTQITAGRLELKLQGQETDGLRRWEGDASLSGLEALNLGQSIAWKNPLIANIQASRQEGSLVIDQLSCRSEFLNLSGGGTWTNAHLTATGDLTQLAKKLERFVDLGADRIAGQIQASGTITRDLHDQISMTTTVQLDDFQWNVSSDNVWEEKHLELVGTAVGFTDGETHLRQIDSGTLRLMSGDDAMSAALTEPLKFHQTSPVTALPVTVNLSGNLETWQNRIRPFGTLSGWNLRGNTTLEANLVAAIKHVEVKHVSVSIEGLEARGPEWIAMEPLLQWETSGVWKFAELEWSSPLSTLACSAISCRIENLAIGLTPAGGLVRLSGNTGYRADLDKISRWTNPRSTTAVYHFAGALEGNARFTEDGQISRGDLDTTIQNFVVSTPRTAIGQKPQWDVLWNEPNLRIAGQCTYDSASDDLQLNTALIAAEGFAMDAQGTLQKASGTQRVDLTGEFKYDWDVLIQRFGESLGQDVQLSGKGQRSFSLRGSLGSLSANLVTTQSGQAPTTPVSIPNHARDPQGSTPPDGSTISGLSDLAGQAGIGWTSARLYGLMAGPADVSATLERGVCQLALLDTVVSEGHLRFSPQIRLDLSPAIISLPEEKVIDQVRLSPALCRSWLKYVLPLLADAAEIDGRVSLDLVDGSLPMMTPSTGEMSGVVAIHTAQVRPGPFSMQLIDLIDRIQSLIRQRAALPPARDRIWMEMPDQTIPFHLAEGRIRHDTIVFQIKDVMFQTSGSVGMDETLDLIIDVAIPDNWVADRKLLKGLKGKSIRIPVGGTLSRPRPDMRILKDIAKQVGGTALEGLLENKLDGLLKRRLNKLSPE